MFFINYDRRCKAIEQGRTMADKIQLYKFSDWVIGIIETKERKYYAVDFLSIVLKTIEQISQTHDYAYKPLLIRWFSLNPSCLKNIQIHE